MAEKHTDGWTHEFPTKPGKYWFYGYRYGKTPCGTEADPELMIMDFRKISNGVMASVDGQFVFKSELEEPHFKKFVPPDLPEF